VAHTSDDRDGGDMYETYRMLGREHEADLEREALRRRQAAALRTSRRSGTPRRRRTLMLVGYVGALLRR
jgi:hypothetical protein